MISVKTTIILFFMGAIFSLQMRAQDSTIKALPLVPVVNPKLTPLYFSDLDEGSPRYVFGRGKLRRLGIQDVGQAVKFVPGVQLKDYGGQGGIRTVSYRSLGANHTAVVFDNNVQLNTQVGAINLSSFESFGMKCIEFNTGQPQSVFSMASAYVPANSVHIYSELMYRDTAIKVRTYQNLTNINAFESGAMVQSNLGSRGSIGTQLFAKYGTGEYDYKYDLTGSSQNYRRNNSEILNYKARIRGGYYWDKARITISFFYNKNQQELPGAVILFNPSNDQKLLNEDTRTDLNFSTHFKKWAIRSSVYSQSNYTKYEDPTFLNMEGFLKATYRQTNHGIGALVSRYLKTFNQRVFLGTDLINSSLSSNEFLNSPSRFKINSVAGMSIKLGAFSIDANLVHQLILDQTRSGDSLLPLNYSKFSPYLSLSVRPFKKQHIRIRSSFKHTFRIPTFNDLYYNFIGNSNLLPEEADLLNLGWTFGKVKKSGQYIEISVDGFFNFVRNKIVAIPTKDLFNWSMQNIGRTRAAGLDVVASYTLTSKDWKYMFSTNHSINYAVDMTDSSSPSYGHQIPYTPVYSSSFSASTSWKGFALINNLYFSGNRYSLNENIAMNYMGPFLEWNLGVDKTIEFRGHLRLGISARAMNVLNKNYEIIRSFPMPGRYYQLTLRFGYK